MNDKTITTDEERNAYFETAMKYVNDAGAAGVRFEQPGSVITIMHYLAWQDGKVLHVLGD